MACMAAQLTAEVKYYLILHTTLCLKPSPAQEHFMSSIFYVLKCLLDCVMF